MHCDAASRPPRSTRGGGARTQSMLTGHSPPCKLPGLRSGCGSGEVDEWHAEDRFSLLSMPAQVDPVLPGRAAGGRHLQRGPCRAAALGAAARGRAAAWHRCVLLCRLARVTGCDRGASLDACDVMVCACRTWHMTLMPHMSMLSLLCCTYDARSPCCQHRRAATGSTQDHEFLDRRP